MSKVPKKLFLQLLSTVFLLVASTGVHAACWFYWYQPKMLEE